jgi:ribonuclease PH
MKTGTVSHANGSAYVELGQVKVVTSVCVQSPLRGAARRVACSGLADAAACKGSDRAPTASSSSAIAVLCGATSSLRRFPASSAGGAARSAGASRQAWAAHSSRARHRRTQDPDERSLSRLLSDVLQATVQLDRFPKARSLARRRLARGMS